MEKDFQRRMIEEKGLAAETMIVEYNEHFHTV